MNQEFEYVLLKLKPRGLIAAVCLFLHLQTAISQNCSYTYSGGPQDGSQGSGGTEKYSPVSGIQNVTVAKGWNLVSLPVEVSDYTRSSVFPYAGSNAFAYENGYKAKDTLENMRGYWLKFDSASALPLSGRPFTSAKISVGARWNMIGGISTPIDTSFLVPVGTTRQSRFFGYSNLGYSETDTLMPGKGYWVKVSSAGKLLVIVNSASPKRSPVQSPFKDNTKFSRLAIKDSRGHLQSLYVGKDEGGQYQINEFELPPAPPKGIFDARFSSQRMVEVFSGKDEKPQEYQIDISSATYPVMVDWELAVDSKEKLELTDGYDGKLLGSISLNKKGSVEIADAKVTSLLLKIVTGKLLPTEYALRQNYPNPFNPSATIEFDLPHPSLVTITIYDILGQEVALLADHLQYDAGTYHREFNAENFASGVFFYRISAQSEGKDFTDVKKMILLK